MTDRDNKTLEFIKAYMAENGYAPSFVDIMDATGEPSKDGVTRTLSRLTNAGLISRVPGVARSIRVVDFSH